MIYLNLDDTVSLLFESVGLIPAKELVKKCMDLGMDELPYRDLGHDSTLPSFDEGYMFNYETDDNEIAFLEILEKDNMILQAGIQIIYKPSFTSMKMKKNHKYLLELSEKHYGSGFLTKVGLADVTNFGDYETVCYLSKMKARGVKSIIFRIGDKKYWRNSMNEEKVLRGEEYLMKNLRLMVEISLFQKKWISLEEEVFGITSVTEDVDWKKLNENGEFLLKEVTNIVVHYDEDREKIHNETDEENLKKLESFLRQSFIYVDVLQRTVMKLSLITNHLYKMTIEPGSWSAKEYLKELDQYKSLCDEYHKEGDKMNEELEKMRNVTLKIK